MTPTNVGHGELLNGLGELRDDLELLRRRHAPESFDEKGVNRRMGVVGEIGGHAASITQGQELPFAGGTTDASMT